MASSSRGKRTRAKSPVEFNDSESEYSEESEPQDQQRPSTTTTGSAAPTAANSAIEITLQPSPHIPAFLTKLFNMVSDKHSNNFIRWAQDGKSFIVEHQEEFSHHVLPRFFKHSNFSSFVRQLNMYGFHKVQHVLAGSLANSNDPETWQFSNENFQRGKPDLLASVKRKSSKPSAAVINKPLNESMGDIKTLLGELNAIKTAQFAISQDLEQLKSQNQLLWQESFTQRQRHEHQQQVIQKILGFLASVVSSDKIKHLGTSPRHLARTGNKKRRLLLGASSDDEDGSLPFTTDLFPNTNTDVNLQDKIVELFHSPTDTSVLNNHSGLIPLQPQPPALNQQDNLSLIPATNSGKATDAIQEDINVLQDNLDNITDYLGLTDKDLTNFSDVDVDSFLQNYLALDEDSQVPTETEAVLDPMASSAVTPAYPYGSVSHPPSKDHQQR